MSSKKKISAKKNKNDTMYCGLLTQHRNGFGFVAVDNDKSRKGEKQDCYIPKNEMNGAMHGDRVAVRRLNSSKKGGRGRPEFSVVTILQEASDTLCGIVREKRGEFFVVPDDARIPFRVRLEENALGDAQIGDVVRVRFHRERGSRQVKKRLPGEVLERVGKPAEIDTQMQLAIEKFALPHIFSQEAVKEAQAFALTSDDYHNRIDLRKTTHITIDGKTAKDFDDAIFIEKAGKKVRLFVSIADVSYYVRQGSTLDKEAYERGTSVYFPGRVIPMLPEELSNHLCSLIPHEDRLTITCEMEFDLSGGGLKMVKRKFYRSVINSKRRFTYAEVQDLLEKEGLAKKQGSRPANKEKENSTEKRDERNREALQPEPQPFTEMLTTAAELAQALMERRFRRGAIDFNLQEPLYLLDDSGSVAAIEKAERNAAHRLIEEFMLIANEAAAEFLQEHLTSPVYRVHEKPDPRKIKEFQEFAGRLGKPLPKFSKEPHWFGEVLHQFAGSRYEYIVNNLLLRTLSQARYSCEELGHFGLASPAYTHFTSPIRRYPDLIVHRMLMAVLENPQGNQQEKEKKRRLQNFAPTATKDAADFLSKRERTAVDAERDINERLKVGYMKDKLGEHFQAVISGVSENALFVELLSPAVSGAIMVEMLGGEYFFFDEKNFRLFGEISRTEYQLGDEIEVVLVDVSMSRRQLSFTVAL